MTHKIHGTVDRFFFELQTYPARKPTKQTAAAQLDQAIQRYAAEHNVNYLEAFTAIRENPLVTIYERSK
jgi:hypothetical protein